MTLRLYVLALLPALALAQPIKLSEAVERALKEYPSLRVSEEQVRAAAAGVNLAQTAYLPKADAIAQVNRATRNNVYGMLLQQSVISPISGPPLPANAGTSVWGSAVGFLVSWEPFDFGLRRANIAIADATRQRAQAAVQRTRFEIAALTADSYLTLLAAEQNRRSAQAALDRWSTLEPIVTSLVSAGLRPGVDSTRITAEQATARNQIARAEEAIQIARVNLAQLLNRPATQIEIDPLRFFTPPPGAARPDTNLDAHPAAQEQKLSIAEVEARRKALDKTYYPKFNTQGTLYARGTGANPNFTTEGGANGLGPNIYNWGVGFTVTFPLMDLPGLRVRKEIEASRTRAEQARYDQLLRDLAAERDRAKARWDSAQTIAANTPTLEKAAQESAAQATARYRAGLSSLVDVADAQKLLAETEINAGLARLALWRALLGVAIAEGDLSRFIAEAESPTPGANP